MRGNVVRGNVTRGNVDAVEYRVLSNHLLCIRIQKSLKKDTDDLWWTIDDTEKEITFELHIKSTGWIALGISPDENSGGVKGADIVVGWVESSSKVCLQGRYAIRNSRPILDNATQDWFLLRGHEKDGWAAIQCKRLLSTCDSMNVPIKSGTNDLIFAYGLTDLDSNRPDMNIAYHDTHRNSRMIPLRSYVDPPSEDKFSRLDTFEFRLNNSAVPSTNTTYHCKIYKAPTGYPIKRYAIAHTILIDPKNVNLVHHLNLYESGPMTTLHGDRLSDGLCDEIADEIKFCSSNFATVWAVDSDAIFRRLFSADCRDSSWIRFYLGNELRKYDFGISVWTKFIRNNTATQYFFNSEKYDFNYQYENRLLKSIKLYPGDSVATRCIYNTISKDKITLGCERTRDEMCLHMFTYYPRMNDFYACLAVNYDSVWSAMMNKTASVNNEKVKEWLLMRTWTSESASQ
ncbi:unnamed protein product [Rotaria socialis]|uniref:DOMON domain-containing protein n=1 Tax=Rotaria socialis TaxID=392032 RepID=A0A821I9J9_9BILA|nr:unnamed protein product [Rotaria socialis]